MKFVKAPEAFITKAGTGNKQTWKLYASKADQAQKKKPIIEAVYVTVKAQEDKQALKIVSIQSPEQNKVAKQKWLTALFKAVVANKASEGKASPTKRSVSVIVAEAAAGVKMSDFKALKEKPQTEIDKAGQKTLVGNWAANLKLAGKPQEYKYTLVRNNNVRFAKTACFVAGTKVWLHDYRQKNIEDVLPEDTVRAFDATTQQEVLGRVTHTIIKQSSTLIGVYTVADTLWVTPEHPFYVNGKWMPAGSLKKGYKLTLLNQSQLLARKTRHLPRSAQVLIDSIVVKDTVATVYNFTVAKHHNYYVGNVGVLVHNNDLCITQNDNVVTVTLAKTGAILGKGEYTFNQLLKIETDTRNQKGVAREKVMDTIYEEMLKKYTKDKIYGVEIEYDSYDKVTDTKDDYIYFQKKIGGIKQPEDQYLRKTAKESTVGKWLKKKNLDDDFKYIIVDYDTKFLELKFVRIFKLNPNNQFTATKTGSEVTISSDLSSPFSKLFVGLPPNSGELDNGELYLVINVKKSNGNCFLDYGSGGVVFDKIFEAFGGKKNVKSILGTWVSGTNLEQFNKYLKGIKSPTPKQLEDAALSTFTGKKAESKGYNKAKIKDTKKDVSSGMYKVVEVKFYY
ncbi:intein splicing domain-containing protein [Microscilla marina]|uniref:Intein C-terminal splicing region domain protein n=1 Tax=Microscilla marina ATCC 23134 TaxID=313606 RepID=A1ZPT3_MICM2|nr:intein splicing domain-containing protein [Microscilla marina]EAY27588.1 intein C-terminal splicing region domain protein [Microscilla marina ATCC 23134]